MSWTEYVIRFDACVKIAFFKIALAVWYLLAVLISALEQWLCFREVDVLVF